MKILIRVDDFGWTSEESENPPHKKRDVGLRLAQKFHAAMNGIPYLAGVIPSEVHEEGQSWLQSRPAGMTVALHGWDHSDPTSSRSEFHGLDSDQIRYRIWMGQQKIGPTRYYIPPFNGFESVCHADPLWHEGIRYIFGREQDWLTPPSPYELEKGVKFIPAWSRLYGALGWQQGAASERLLSVLHDIYCSGNRQPGFAVMTLHLPWEHARDPEFVHAKKLQEYKKMFITSEEFVSQIK